MDSKLEDFNCENFYSFDGKLLSKNVTAIPENPDLSFDKKGIDDLLRLILGDYTYIDFPVLFRHKYGNSFGDLIETGYAGLYLISDELKNLFEKNKITGWKSYPITLLNKKGIEIHGYSGFSILGRAGKMDFSKSEIRIDNFSLKFYKGFYLDCAEWDGSDIFLPKGFYGTFVTKRVIDLVKKNSISNIAYKNLCEKEYIEQAVDSYNDRFAFNSKYF